MESMAELDIPITTEVNVEDLIKDVAEVQAILQYNNVGNAIDINEIYEKLEELTYVTREERIEYVTTQLLHKAGIIVESSVAPENRVFRFPEQLKDDDEIGNKSDMCTEVSGQSGRDETHVSQGNEVATESVCLCAPEFNNNTSALCCPDISSQCGITNENELEHQSNESENSGVCNINKSTTNSEVLMEEAKLLYSFFPNYDIEVIYSFLEVYKDCDARIDIVTETILQVDSYSAEHHEPNVFKVNNDCTNDKPGMILRAPCFQYDTRLNDCFIDQTFSNNIPSSNFSTSTEMPVLEQMTFRESNFNGLPVSEERGVNQNVEQFLTKKSELKSQYAEQKLKEVSKKFASSSPFSKSHFNPNKTISDTTKQIDSAASLACLPENCYSLRNTCNELPRFGSMNNILTLDSSKSKIYEKEECYSVKLSNSCDEINTDMEKLFKPTHCVTQLKQKSFPLLSSKTELLHSKSHSIEDLLCSNSIPEAELCRPITRLVSETENSEHSNLENECGLPELNLYRNGSKNEFISHFSTCDSVETEKARIILDSSFCSLNPEYLTSLNSKTVENHVNETEMMDLHKKNSESLISASARTCENMVNDHLSSMSAVSSEVTQNSMMPTTNIEDLIDLDFVIVQKSDVENFSESRVRSEDDDEQPPEDYFEDMDAVRTSKNVGKPLRIYHIEVGGAKVSNIAETHVTNSVNKNENEINENIENKFAVNNKEVDCNEISRAKMSEKVEISSFDGSNKIYGNKISEHSRNQATVAETVKVSGDIEHKLLVVDIEDPRFEMTNSGNHQVLDHAEVSSMTEKNRKLTKLSDVFKDETLVDLSETQTENTENHLFSGGKLSAFGSSENLQSLVHIAVQSTNASGNAENQLESSEICVNTKISETQQLMDSTEIQAVNNTELLENIENQLVLDYDVSENEISESFEVFKLHECNLDNISKSKQNSKINNFQVQTPKISKTIENDLTFYETKISESDVSNQFAYHIGTEIHKESGNSLIEEIVSPGRGHCGMVSDNFICEHENQDSEVNRNVAKLKELFPDVELNYLKEVSLYSSSLVDAVNKICDLTELEQDVIIDSTSEAQCSEVSLTSKPHQGCRKKEISYNEFVSCLSHLDPIYLQETWKKIGNNYGAIREFMADYKQGTTEDQHYHTLLSLFPQAEPAFLRKTCNEIGNNEVSFQNFIEEQLQQDKSQARYYTLLAMFPQSDSAYLHAKSIEIGNDETAMRAFVVEQLEKNNGDDSYHALLAMFPEADPALLREAVKRIGDDEDAMKAFVTEQLEDMDAVKFETLLAVLPDADPDYLNDAFKRLGNNEESIKEFLMEAIESKNYPTREAYLKRQETAALQRKYKDEFVIEDFLEMFPDPWKYFTNKNNKSNELIRKYETAFLERRYISLPLDFLNKSFQKNQYNLTLTCQDLDKRQGQLSRVLNSGVSYSNDVPVSFLQEVAFIEHEQKISSFIKLKEQKKHEAFILAKASGELLECMCCYDTEVLAEDMATCIEGHLFCKDCIKKSAEVVIGNGQSSFPCLTDCSAEFSLKIIKMVLKPTVFSRMLQRKQLEEVQAAGIQDLESCPFCDFSTILPSNDKVFLCFNPECMRDSCRKCKRPNHIPLHCDEVESKEIKMRTFIEDRMTDALIRTCLKCKKKFIKELGCNKMVCTCGAAMCYICRQPVTDYSHFNGQGGTEFHKCPLYSDIRIIHDVAVQEEGLKAKKEVQAQNPDVQLKNDPTQI